MTGTAAFDGWVQEARSITVLEAVNRRTHALKRTGSEWVGPCPACGGTDRFSINPAKNVFFCRQSGCAGDAIAMVEYLDGCDFLIAVETLAGRPSPDDLPESDTARAEREERLARRAEEVGAAAAAEKTEENVFRRRERERAFGIWSAAGELAGSPGEAYFAWRALIVPAGAHLRYAPMLPYWDEPPPKGNIVYRGPAIVAAITGPKGGFVGAHLTWIDPAFLDGRTPASGSGKAEIVHPQTGEVLDPKKVRGTQRGGRIQLVRCAAPAVGVCGEGYETTLSVWRSLAESGWALLDNAAFWAGLNLGNLSGRAEASIKHPTATVTDKRGRVRARRVPGPVPDLDPNHPAMPVPETVEDLFWLGDGDSDRFATECAMRRAVARHARPGRRQRIVWAAPGQDFNVMLRGAP